MLSTKQREFWDNCHHRWNIKTGATRSGKTYMDYYLIAKRILATKGKQGIRMLLGNTRSTLERNIIDPMREMFGPSCIGIVRQNNTVDMFGEKVYALGADKVTQVDKLRGSGIIYCYGDEITTWNKEVFEMLKSRLSLPVTQTPLRIGLGSSFSQKRIFINRIIRYTTIHSYLKSLLKV